MSMKKRKDILDKAINYLKNEPVPPGPPHQVMDATLAKLTKACGESQDTVSKPIKIFERIRPFAGLMKVAVAAAILIAAGYMLRWLSAPRPPDIEQLQAALEPSLRASLEPAIRQDLLEEMKRYWRLGLASSYVKLKDELNQQYHRDLNELAAQTLAASGVATNQLLEELIEAINAAQMQDRRWVAAALEQIESNRLQDKTLLTNGLETLAFLTEDGLQRTKQDMVRLLVNTQPDSLSPNVSETSNIPKERSEK